MMDVEFAVAFLVGFVMARHCLVGVWRWIESKGA